AGLAGDRDEVEPVAGPWLRRQRGRTDREPYAPHPAGPHAGGGADRAGPPAEPRAGGGVRGGHPAGPQPGIAWHVLARAGSVMPTEAQRQRGCTEKKRQRVEKPVSYSLIVFSVHPLCLCASVVIPDLLTSRTGLSTAASGRPAPVPASPRPSARSAAAG